MRSDTCSVHAHDAPVVAHTGVHRNACWSTLYFHDAPVVAHTGVHRNTCWSTLYFHDVPVVAHTGVHRNACWSTFYFHDAPDVAHTGVHRNACWSTLYFHDVPVVAHTGVHRNACWSTLYFHNSRCPQILLCTRWWLGLARTVYIHVFDCIFGDFLAKITVYTLYIYGSGQPYSWCPCCGTQPGIHKRAHVHVFQSFKSHDAPVYNLCVSAWCSCNDTPHTNENKKGPC